MRRVDELPTADVDPVVAEPVEEDEVAWREVRARDGAPVAVLHRRVVRQRDADLRIDVHDEARAVEARARRRAAPPVRDAEVLHRNSDDAAVAGGPRATAAGRRARAPGRGGAAATSSA